ncbi:hypothetical protein GCM10027085_62060 [Spirosoma aerophilum]
MPGLVDEASGLVDSRSMNGQLWVQEDGGTPAQLSLLAHDGSLTGRYALPGTTNRDWEDLTIGPGPQPNTTYLYLADLGDNNATNDVNTIYRFAEPGSLSEPVHDLTQIQFRYPDGARDAETLLLDPLTRDLWIVTKRETKVQLYRLAYPQSTSSISLAERIGELSLSLVTGGSLSADGSEIILKTYTGLYYWTRQPGESVGQTLLRAEPRQLGYQIEPQGETVCFDKEGKGFFTLSERASASSVTLNYYSRLP